ncbi:MAG: pyoverdine biosynthesis protein PvcA [Wenzhouxiangellaceae bacterium]
MHVNSANRISGYDFNNSEASGSLNLEFTDSQIDTAKKILNQIFARRRLLPAEPDQPGCFMQEAEPHLGKIAAAVAANKRINLILPGFPAKSPNRLKTLSPLPDLAERHALQNLNTLCDEISQIHSPGAYVTICSDGRVFADLVRIPEQDVTEYGMHLREYARRFHPDAFEFFNLDNVYSEVKDYTSLREELLVRFGESIYDLRKRIKMEPEAKAMYQGITRFIFEDYAGLDIFKNESRTTLQKLARSVAYRLIQRSNAWTRLLEQHFDSAIRLSIHPQFRVSRKIGINLASTDDCWLTPWHGVALKNGDQITLVKRKYAEQVGLLAFEDGRPSHFEYRGGIPSSS